MPNAGPRAQGYMDPLFRWAVESDGLSEQSAIKFGEQPRVARVALDLLDETSLLAGVLQLQINW